MELALTAYAEPLPVNCYSATEPLTLTLKNKGSSLLDFSVTPAAVQVNVSGAATAAIAHTVNSGALAPGATQNVTLPTALNMLPVGTYNFTAFAKIPGDPDAANDTLHAERQTDAVFPLPQSSTLTGFSGANLSAIFSGWREASGFSPFGTQSHWLSSTGLGGAGNQTIKIYLSSNFKNEWIIGPKVVPGPNTIVRFKAAITTATSFGVDPRGMRNTDDKVQVMVSTDCGATFNPIYTFDATTSAGLSNVLTDYGFSLSQYAGQEIIVAFYATEGPIQNVNYYDFHLDDLFIGDLPPADLGVTAFLSPPAAACYTSAEPVTVTIRNFGVLPVDLSNTPVTVKAHVSGAVSDTLSAVINTGLLGAGDTLNVTLSPGLNMLTAGTYNLKAFTTILQDNNAANDTATLQRTRYPVSSLPQTIDFNGFTDANLSQVFPAWREASGIMPTGHTSSWKHAIGLGNAQNTTAKIYLNSVWEKAWLIGPTFTPNANTRLTFEAAITEWFNLQPDTLGMAGSDDKVQVMLSVDCGVTYQPLFTFDSASSAGISNVLKSYALPLGGFANREISLAFFATDGTLNDPNAYAFHLDNIRIEDITGLKEEAPAHPLVIYPNPNQGNFHVDLHGFGAQVQLTLKTLTGQLVTEKLVSGNEKRYAFAAKNLKPGIYVLQAVSEKQSRVVRVKIQ